MFHVKAAIVYRLLLSGRGGWGRLHAGRSAPRRERSGYDARARQTYCSAHFVGRSGAGVSISAVRQFWERQPRAECAAEEILRVLS